MPWQQQVVDAGLEIDPDTGRLAYRELVVTVMRQSGKSVLVLGVETDRCVSWDSPQKVAYTAQTGWDARRKLVDDHAPVVTGSPLRSLVDRVLRGAGNEGILFKSGSRIDVMASTGTAGHGRTLDLGVIDEAMSDEDDRREQAILPAMATRPDAQLMVVSTAGTDGSTYLRRKVEAGRAQSEADLGSGIAYFEWSIPDDADIDDPETWWRYMPALGWTISEAAVAHARASMSDSEFRRGFGNQWTVSAERTIPLELWRSVQDEGAAPSGGLRFAFDVLPDRSAAAIASCGGGVVELVDHRPGTSWVIGRLKELQGRWGGDVTFDGGGPGSALLPDLERERVSVTPMGNQDVIAACARMFDHIADGEVTVRPSPAMDAAVDGLAKRPVGDRFVWSRTTSRADVTPFMAATLAYVPGGSPMVPMVAFV
jgi:hypothetical protein